jgi:hypothetical protein
MTGRVTLPIVAVAAGVVAVTFVPGLSQSLRDAVGLASDPGRQASGIGRAPNPRECRGKNVVAPDEQTPSSAAPGESGCIADLRYSGANGTKWLASNALTLC